MFLKYFNLNKNNLNNQSFYFYQEIVNHSNDFIKNNLNNRKLDFNEVFEIFSVVIIFYLKKLKDENSAKNKIISQTIIDNFVEDLDQHFREQGIGDMSIGKYVKKYVKKFYFRLKILDEIFKKNKQLDINEYQKKVRVFHNDNTGTINANLVNLYNRILIEK